MEISSPAGSFASAISAFENGADSVYFGLKMFSARAAADNFSIEDYRRIRKYALDTGKKIYVALNTIITDALLGEVYSVLKVLDFYGVDGVIVQDWGVVELIREHFASLALHASTQMAVQNSDGVKMLKAFGFERVVLARELSLKEVKAIRDENKDIELKVFVHGALCYCVSGLCFASRFLLGVGSANRGTCKQVCRMSFGNSREHPFSLADLRSDRETIKALEKMGIDSIKIEGRLKSASYSLWASAYYRAIVDGASDEDVEKCRERLLSSFSRATTGGYLAEERDIYLSGYIGHRGLKAGCCNEKGRFVLSCDMLPHDGVMLLTKNQDVYKRDFSLYAKKGDEIALKFGKYNPSEGDELYKIKDARDNAPVINSESYPLSRYALDIKVQVERDKIALSTAFKGVSVQKAFDALINQAHSPQDSAHILEKAFSRQSEYFTLGNISLNSSVDNPFLPSSILKKIAIDFYELCDKKAGDYFSTPLDIMGDYDFEKQGRAFKKKADLVLSPDVFGKRADDKALFIQNSVEVNNISQLANIIDEKGRVNKGIKPVVIGPYFNIANSKAVEFFEKLLSDKLVGVYISPELDGSEREKLSEYLIADVDYKRTLPMFIHRIPGKNECRKVYLKDVKI